MGREADPARNGISPLPVFSYLITDITTNALNIGDGAGVGVGGSIGTKVSASKQSAITYPGHANAARGAMGWHPYECFGQKIVCNGV